MTLAEQLRKTYQQAGKEVQKKMDTFWKKHEAKAKRLLKDVQKGKITEEDYKKWLSGQVFIGKRWQEKKDDITQVYVQADEKARRIINGTNKNEFVRFANRQGNEIKSHVAGYSFDLYDKHTVERLLRTDPKMLPEWRIDEPKDYTWNAKRVQNSVMQGIIQGESIPQIAKRLEEGLATDNNRKMNLFARTAITGAQNAGRMERLHEAVGMGVKVKKKWLATMDDRTRDAHADLDGQEVDIDEKFRVTEKGQTYEIDFPGDPNADPSMTYNCRCTLVYVYPEHQQLPAERLAYETDESGNRKSSLVKDQTYREWKGKEPLARPEGAKAPGKLDINAAVDALPRYKDPRQRDYFDDENWKQNQLESVDKETADRLEKLYQSFTDADDAKFKEAVVKVSDLKTSQEYVDAKKLKEMLESYDGQTITGAATDDDNGIRVFKVDGEYIVIDGNHRANAALLQGQDDIKVMVYDVSAKEPKYEAQAEPASITPRPDIGETKKFQESRSVDEYFRGSIYESQLGGINRTRGYGVREEDGKPATKWQKSLTFDQTNAIERYTGNDYEPLNNFLRGIWDKEEARDNLTGDYSLNKEIGLIDAGIKKFDLKEPITVYRTCEREFIDRLQEGSIFHDEGYGSTSLLPIPVASGDVHMEIDVPAGKGVGAYLEGVSWKEGEEFEFLLARGADYYVEKKEIREDGVYVKVSIAGFTR